MKQFPILNKQLHQSIIIPQNQRFNNQNRIYSLFINDRINLIQFPNSIENRRHLYSSRINQINTQSTNHTSQKQYNFEQSNKISLQQTRNVAIINQNYCINQKNNQKIIKNSREKITQVKYISSPMSKNNKTYSGFLNNFTKSLKNHQSLQKFNLINREKSYPVISQISQIKPSQQLLKNYYNSQQIAKNLIKNKMHRKLNYSYRSKKGYYLNTNKINQDNFIVLPSINNYKQNFFAVCDGHGDYGHHVSSYIKKILTQLTITSQKIRVIPKQQLFQLHKIINYKLINQSKIDLNFSGSTLNCCYFIENKIYCSNIGDSRSIIGFKDIASGKWEVKQLSKDHKPSDFHEAQRITKLNGRIESYIDQSGNKIGPLRVWLKKQNFPGLAMTRSFGDLIAAKVGVIWQPEILEHTISQNDKILLIASDGVWEFLSNEDIINKLIPFYESNNIDGASQFLLQYAQNSWKKLSPNMDDITFILIFIHH